MAEDNTKESVYQQMQQSLHLWAGLLQATGGTLVPDKCFWYHIHQVWNQHKGAWVYELPKSEHWLLIMDNKGTMVTILQLVASEACRTLGIRLAPDRNNEVEYQHLLEVARNWQSAMAVQK